MLEVQGPHLNPGSFLDSALEYFPSRKSSCNRCLDTLWDMGVDKTNEEITGSAAYRASICYLMLPAGPDHLGQI